MTYATRLAFMLVLPCFVFSYATLAQSRHDVELTVNALPGERGSSAVTGPNVDYGDDSANELALLYRFHSSDERFVAFVLGLGLDVIAVDYGATSENLYGFRVEPGVAFRVSDRWRIEGMAVFAVGGLSVLWGQAGAMVRPVYFFDSGLSVHAQYGHIYMGTLFSEVDDEISGTRRKGNYFGAGLAYRFR